MTIVISMNMLDYIGWYARYDFKYVGIWNHSKHEVHLCCIGIIFTPWPFKGALSLPASVRPSVCPSVRPSIRPSINFTLSAQQLVTDLRWNHQICTKHASWDTLGWYWKWRSLTLAFKVIFSCDQAALWMVQSVRPSVRLSVCLSVRLSVTPFWLCSHHPIIMKFSGVITSDKSDVHAKGQGQRSKVKVTEVTTQIFVSGL